MPPRRVLHWQGDARCQQAGPWHCLRRMHPAHAHAHASASTRPTAAHRRPCLLAPLAAAVCVRRQVFYELHAERERQGKQGEVALVRLEQLAPFPFDLVCREIFRYPNAELLWCQEEPMNMGAYYHVQVRTTRAPGRRRWRRRLLAAAAPAGRCCRAAVRCRAWCDPGRDLLLVVWHMDACMHAMHARALMPAGAAPRVRSAGQQQRSPPHVRARAPLPHMRCPSSHTHATPHAPPPPRGASPQPRLESCLRAEGHATTGRVSYAGRLPSASTATGYGEVHAQEQARLIAEALDLDYKMPFP